MFIQGKFAISTSSKILVLDNNRSFFNVIKKRFEFERHSLEFLKGSSRLLNSLKHDAPELLLINASLRHVDCWDLCRKVKEAKPSVIVYFLIDKSQLNLRARVFECGADDYLVLPCLVEEVMSRIQVRLALHRLLSMKEGARKEGSTEHPEQQAPRYHIESKTRSPGDLDAEDYGDNAGQDQTRGFGSSLDSPLVSGVVEQDTIPDREDRQESGGEDSYAAIATGDMTQDYAGHAEGDSSESGEPESEAAPLPNPRVNSGDPRQAAPEEPEEYGARDGTRDYTERDSTRDYTERDGTRDYTERDGTRDYADDAKELPASSPENKYSDKVVRRETKHYTGEDHTREYADTEEPANSSDSTVGPAKHGPRLGKQRNKKDNWREPGAEIKVLIADDDSYICQLLQHFFTKEGWAVSVAEDGEEAERLIKETEFDFILLDNYMPFRSGFDILQWLRETGLRGSSKIIMLSAQGREESIIEAFSLGADDFIAKPFSPSLVVGTLKRFLS